MEKTENMAKSVNIAILGFGVVGGGTEQVIREKSELLRQRTGRDISVKYILVRSKKAGWEHDHRIVTDFSLIAEDKSVDIVVEAIGGIEPAFTYVKTALEKGKSVVTSNKELVAEKGQLLMEIAQKNGVNFMFEGAVGGAVPVIHNLRETMKANTVLGVAGILNGTTNYILTKMIEENLPFDTALKQAQRLGYAEADPSADVDGIDTCRKICILADLLYGKNISPSRVYTCGIRDISARDVSIIKNRGGCVKLLGKAEKKADGSIFIVTAPFAVFSKGAVFAALDVYNRVEFNCDNAGIMAFYGRGAGSLPTASAVVNDICRCVLSAGKTLYSPWEQGSESRVADWKKEKTCHYINLAADREKTAGIFDKAQFLSDETGSALIVKDISFTEIENLLYKNGIKLKSHLFVY